MKVPFSYQKTEFDCGPTSLTNALSFLFDREEIPPEMIRRIMAYCLDGFDGQGNPGEGQKEADQVHLEADSPILSVLRQGGVAVIRVIYECGHYVLVTGLGEPDRLLVFDGYYEEGRDIEDLVREGIGIIPDQPRGANRLVPISHMNSESTGSYQLGPVPRREAILLSRTDLTFHPL